MRFSSIKPAFVATGLWVLFLGLQFGFVFSTRPFGYDEGTYWATLRLMSKGEALYSSIFCSQFPLFPHLMHFFYRHLGSELSGARIGVVLISSTLIPAFYLLGNRLKSARLGMLLAILGSFDSVFFHLSHQLVGDAPAVALFVWAVYLSVSNSRISNFASGMLLAAGLQTKPVLLPLIPLFPLAVMSAGGTIRKLSKVRWIESAVWILGFILFSGLTLWYWDWFAAGGNHQFQGGTFASSLGANWSVWAKILMFFGHSGYAYVGNILVPPLAIFAYFQLAKNRELQVLPALAALGLMLAAFAVHRNINWYHYTIFVPFLIFPIARLSESKNNSQRAFKALVLIAIVTNFILAVRPWIFPDHDEDKLLERKEKIVELLRLHTTADDWVIADDLFPIASAERFSPPALADISWARVRFRSVTCESLGEYFANPRVKAVVFTKIFSEIDCGEAEFVAQVQKAFPHQVLDLKKAKLFLRK